MVAPGEVSHLLAADEANWSPDLGQGVTRPFGVGRERRGNVLGGTLGPLVEGEHVLVTILFGGQMRPFASSRPQHNATVEPRCIEALSAVVLPNYIVHDEASYCLARAVKNRNSVHVSVAAAIPCVV